MALWNKNDRESSKPNWLTEEQKRQCFRTVRGWEIPLMGFEGSTAAGVHDWENIYGASSSNTGLTSVNQTIFRSSTYIGPTELLVCMPMDATASSGMTNADMAGYLYGERRGATAGQKGWVGTAGLTTFQNLGYTAGNAANYYPYFTTPLTGDTIYAVKGMTSYIPIIVNDSNMCDLLRLLTISGTGIGTGLTTGVVLLTSFTAGSFADVYSSVGFSGSATAGAAYNTALTGAALVTAQNYWFNQSPSLTGGVGTPTFYDGNKTSYVGNRYGGVGGLTQGAALLRVGIGATFGTTPIQLYVNDRLASSWGSVRGLTGTIVINLTVTSGLTF